jgi:Na+/H+ antiporter NhaD/arsenite permease-like protein
VHIQLPHLTIVAAYIVFLLSYFVFAVGKFPGMKIDRTGAAIIGAVLMVAFRVLQPGETLQFINFSTIVLLFSMMLLVAYLQLAGFFDWVGDIVARQLDPQYLLPAVIFVSGILSAFFVNDIICLMMTPFTLIATRRMGLRPLPYLLAVATASNIGSVATITGNPQNILVGSLSGIPYVTFLAHLGPVALGGLCLDWLIIWLLGTRNAADRLAEADAERSFHNRSFQNRDTRTLEEHSHIVASTFEKKRLIKPAIVMGLVLGGFVAGFPPSLVAALGAAIMLITHKRDPGPVYAHVDWSLLVFFVGLFVIVGGAEKAGLIAQLLSWGRGWNLQNRAVFMGITAGLANIVSNVPAVMLLKSLVPRFADPRTGWLLLAMSSTLAGNLTITGSIANIIVVERARPDVEISLGQYMRVGVPVTAATLALGWLWLLLVH